MSYFIPFLLCCNLCLLFMGNILCNTFSSWWLGTPVGSPGMQAGLCSLPVAGGVMVISKGLLQVCHLPMAITRQSQPGDIAATPPGCHLGSQGAAQGCCPRWWQRLPLLCCPFPSHTWLRTPGSPSAILPCSGKLRQGAVPGVRSCVPLIWGALGHHKALAAFAQMPKWCFPPSPPVSKPKDGFLGLW